MEESKEKLSSNREVKSSAFTTYFGEPENAAKLFSALDGQEVLPINTAEKFVPRKADSHSNTGILRVL